MILDNKTTYGKAIAAMRILVIDDDEILVDILQRSLSSQRHIVDIAEDGRMGWEYIQAGEYELVLLDINLPGLDGVSLCEKMRSQGYATPILLMTAKNASQDRILGLDAGADDYLIKPLDLGELNARVRALSRRGEVAPSIVLNVNGLTLDPSSCEVSYQQQPVKLTAKEYSLLEIFLRNPARVFSRSQILDKIWTFDDPPLEESVKAHIKGLRKKLKKVGVVGWIENVYGIGYRLNPQVAQSSSESNNSNSLEQEFEQKMTQVWLKYQDKMLERIKVLRTAVFKLKQAQLTSDLQHNAERAAHKLAGVLGMFSKDAGTDLARQIESLLQSNPVLNIQQQQQFISLVADLDSLLALNETSVANAVSQGNLLLISADDHLSWELQHLSRNQGLRWHQAKNLDQAKIWLQENSPYISPYIVVIDVMDAGVDITATNQPDYLSFINELNLHTPGIPTLVLSDSNSFSDYPGSFLIKPVTPSAIWQTTNKLIKQNQSAITSILIVDDDVVFLAALQTLLEPWDIKVSTLAEPLHFWDTLKANQPDLVILDVEMPEITGIKLCQTLRSNPAWQELPVLFLTAKQDVATIQQIFEIGGDDYISKPVVGAELIARINNRLDRSRLLHRLATQDRLTGLSNRTESSRKIESLLRLAQNSEQPFCLALLKISELQQINLQYGHHTGDRILAQWGKVIQTFCRNHEVTGYWGNGDFVIAMPNLAKIQSKEYLRELITILRRQIFTAEGGQPQAPPTCSRDMLGSPERRGCAFQGGEWLTSDADLAQPSLESNPFYVNFSYAVAEFPGDGQTLHALYQTCTYYS